MSKKIMFNDKYGLTQAVLYGRKTMRDVFRKTKYATASFVRVVMKAYMGMK